MDTERVNPASHARLGAISTNSGEFTIRSVPVGIYQLRVTRLGYDTLYRTIKVVRDRDTITLSLELERAASESQIVVVSGTRTERYIGDVPVRIETIEQEDIEEKLMEKPTSVVELLNESVGTRIQTTSGTSNAANIRIQGLDGRYTQVLVDGLPNYSGLSSQFGITQLMPLNLRRVEIVKGASSALYGPDAIAGIVNFITNDPHEKPEFAGVLNVTNQKGYDVSGFYGEEFDPVGLTALLSYDRQQLFDVDRDGFSDIAGFTHLTFTPKVTIALSDRVTTTVTGTYFSEHRRGGSMDATDAAVGALAPYIEDHTTRRRDLSSTISLNIADDQSATIRGAITDLTQDSYYGATSFDGTQLLRYADAQYVLNAGMQTLQLGASYSGDNFLDRTPGLVRLRSYDYTDVGAWLQDEADFSDTWKAVASVRIDRHNLFGTFITPRASLIFRPVSTLSFRVGGGTGFKAPTIFLEEAALNGFKDTYLSMDVLAERAQSGSFDIGYHTALGDIAINLAPAFFLTNIEHALVSERDTAGTLVLNATGSTITKGIELSTSFTLDELKLAINYAYLDAMQTNRGSTYQLELNPRHWLGSSLTYENEEDGIKAGIESYYIGKARIEGDPFRSSTPSYWLVGALVEKAFGHVRVFLNSENLLNVRQSNYDATFIGDPEAGTYHPLPIYAPQEGRTINAGILFKL